MEISGNRQTITMKDTCLSSYKWSRAGNMLVIFYISKYSSPSIYLVIGPHWPGVLFTSLIICLVTYLNIVLSPSPSIIYPGALITFAILAQIFLYLTALVDPGIQLNQKNCTGVNNNNSNNSNNGNGVGDDDGDDGDERLSFLEQNNLGCDNKDVPFCDICEIDQWDGIAHCSYCNCCIDQLDHHCPWMGKCIGKKNMIWFKCFIMLVAMYIIFVVMGLIFF